MRQFKKNQGFSSKTAKTKKEYLFAPKTQGQMNKYATFTSVEERIVQEAQKKYKYRSDLAKSLKDGALISLSSVRPIMSILTETNEEKRKVEQKMYEIDYQEEMSRYLDRKSYLEENMKKLYTKIFTNYCTKNMYMHSIQWCLLWTHLQDGTTQDSMMMRELGGLHQEDETAIQCYEEHDQRRDPPCLC